MMLLKIFTLPFSETLEGFDDNSLRAFMADKEIIKIKEQFFIRNNIPYWAVMIVYKPISKTMSVVEKNKSKEERKEDYLSFLTDKSMPLFNLLREWRNERALKEGVPPYVLFTNRQLAEIASKFPDTLNLLSAVEGVGKAKIGKYGRDILGIVQTSKENQKKAIKANQTITNTRKKD